MPDDLSTTLSWVHFGDLHITKAFEKNYADLQALVADANAHLAGAVDFAVLPGDNADDGTTEEYRLIRRAIDALRIPLEIRPGDHDRKSGTLEAYARELEPRLWRERAVGPYRCLFLNSLDGKRKEDFDFGPDQLAWFLERCAAAERDHETLALFMHTYPSELGESAPAVRDAIARYPVAVVDMGHTHYNEVANDGRTIYAATRSTGQIEEGPVGFSITTIDRGVVSWKFNACGSWPLVKIVSPAHAPFVIDPSSPNQIVRGDVAIRARIWGGEAIEANAYVDDGPALPMTRLGATNLHAATWHASGRAEGEHRIRVEARTPLGEARDTIVAIVFESGPYPERERAALDLDNAVEADPERGLLGTRLGPNAHGIKW